MKDIGGLHLIMDGRFEDHASIDVETVLRTFDDLVSVLDMTYLTKPVATEVPLDVTKVETEEDEGGISIYAQITTSHIALHVWPLRKVFCMDVFSCKSYDVNLAGELLWKRLNIKDAVVWALRRNGNAKTSMVSSSVHMLEKWQSLTV